MTCTLFENKNNNQIFWIESDELWNESTKHWKQYLRRNDISVKSVTKKIYEGRGRLRVETSRSVSPEKISYLVEDNEPPIEGHYYRAEEEFKLKPISYSWDFDNMLIDPGTWIRVEGELKDQNAWQAVIIDGQYEGKYAVLSVDDWVDIRDKMVHSGEFMVDNPSEEKNSEDKEDPTGLDLDDAKKDNRDYSRVSDEWPDLDVREPIGKWMKGSPVTDQFFNLEYDEPETDDEDESEEDA